MREQSVMKFKTQPTPPPDPPPVEAHLKWGKIFKKA
jgi:hypothetical protein